MGLGGLFSWVQEQFQYLLFIALFVALIYTGYKRAWIMMGASILGLAFVGIFIVNPDMIINLGDWVADILKLGQS